MQPIYVTFGQVHVHVVNGQTFDKDCVAVIMAPDADEGRQRAAQFFGSRFYATHKAFNVRDLRFFPRGCIMVEPTPAEEIGLCTAEAHGEIPCTDHLFYTCRMADPDDNLTRDKCEYWKGEGK